MALIMLMICMISMLLSYQVSSLETYIVHVNLPKGRGWNDTELKGFYQGFLPKTKGGDVNSSRLVHSYHNVATGFAAKLSPEEVKETEKMEGFVSASVQKKMSLHTTRSANFLGLYKNSGVWLDTNYGEGVIIGILDTGIAPAHASFDDKHMPSPPEKWKGTCEFNACNNKLIGARNFVSDFPGPPFDDEGHGTHVSSTAAGTFVKSANVFGMANGTAVGMAPRAHIAMYKVCSSEGCGEADVLAAMDAAIDDGVDVLSISLGALFDNFYSDGIAIGAFAAIQKGIFVSCSAGNFGPVSTSLSNEAPWILTVGASTIDRKIIAIAELGLGQGYVGESLYQPSNFSSSQFMPLVDAGAGGNATTAVCRPGSLDNLDVEGKVVLCQRGGGIGRVAKGQTVKDAGGAAMIMMNDEINGFSTLADAHVLPASHVSFYAGDNIRAYINSSTTPNATILFRGTVLGNKNSPMVASFSSRGPSFASPGILKPDIIGPGVSILAAWPVPVDNTTKINATFNVISGTSMSCPHLSGIAALLKSAHPSWSPAAIKSAIMTSATRLNLRGDPIVDERELRANMFATGAGHVNPAGANDPGLVYDLQPVDYIPYLCGLGYTDQQVQTIVQQPVSCSNVTSITEAQLNYPSFSVQVGAGGGANYTRTVTNVGEAKSNYSASVVYYSDPVAVIAVVKPDTLSFCKVNQEMTYQVSFSKVSGSSNATYVEGAILWRSSKRTVTTPFYVEVV